MILSKRNRDYYLDACATTPVHSDVIETVASIQRQYWANPSSNHLPGIKAAELVERSRFRIANKLNTDIDEIVFTSGATESINLALKGIASKTKPGRIVISNVEHPAVDETAKGLISKGWELEYWPVDQDGVIRVDLIDKYIQDPTKIVSIIWGQSEIGSVQPIKTIGEICKKRNIIFHSDATQILPHGLFNWKEIPVDMLSASSHKLQGPKGIGVLFIKSNMKQFLAPIIDGGGQESFLRSGTEPVELIAGFSKAIELLNGEIRLDGNYTLFPSNKVTTMTYKLAKYLESLPQLKFTGSVTNRLPNHLSYLLRSVKLKPLMAREFVYELSKKGVHISSGSACSSRHQLNSKIMTAINVEEELKKSGIRISLGAWLEEEDMDNVYSIIRETL